MNDSPQKAENTIMIGELCRLAGCTPRTVRFYEEKGIIAVAGETPGGRKLYAKGAAAIIHLVRVLQEAGYSLEEAAGLLALRASGKTRHKALTLELRRRLSALADAIEGKRAMLDDARRAVFSVLKQTDRCRECRSEDCAGCDRLEELKTLGLLSQ